MNYEQKYNASLEQAKKELATCGSMDCEAARLIFRLFPQLCESEDKRITRAINNMLPFIPDEAYANNGVTKEDVLAWLEKQKECVADSSKTSAGEDERIRRVMLEHFKSKTKETWCGLPVVDIIAYLEKQKGLTTENNMISSKKCNKSPLTDEAFKEQLERVLRNNVLDTDIRITGDTVIGAKQKEQRSADNVSIEEHIKGFKALCDDLSKPSIDSGKQKEQNPEEGDNETEIQKAFRKGKSAGRKEVFDYPEEYGLQKPAEYIKRNSKEWYTLLAEQYDKGFWKGKAEQKPAELSEDDEDMIVDIIDIIQSDKAVAKIDPDHPASQERLAYYDKEITFLKSLLEGVKCRLKTEWSEDYREEDIQTRFAFYTYKDDPNILYLSNVFVEESSRNHGLGIRILKAAEKVAEVVGATTIRLKVKQDSLANAWYRKRGYGYVAFEDGYDWLEKNLEYLKPTKPAEWSDEDEHNLNSVISLVHSTSDGAWGSCIGDRIENWLKSLRPSWKPSEEELVALKNVGGILRDYGHGELAKMVFMIEGKLANLSVINKSIWKPSEEQMKTLRNAIALAAGNKVLAGLYEQLKKLM